MLGSSRYPSKQKMRQRKKNTPRTLLNILSNPKYQEAKQPELGKRHSLHSTGRSGMACELPAVQFWKETSSTTNIIPAEVVLTCWHTQCLPCAPLGDRRSSGTDCVSHAATREQATCSVQQSPAGNNSDDMNTIPLPETGWQADIAADCKAKEKTASRR